MSRRSGGRRVPALLALLVIVSAAFPAFSGEAASEKLDIIRRIISERGEYDLAEPQLKDFINEYKGRPAAAEALALLGYCQDKLKKNAEAAESFSRVLSEYPNAPAPLRSDASLGAADAYFRLGRYQDAVKHYSTVLDLNARPEQAEAALLWRGEANYRQGVAAADSGGDASRFLTSALADFSRFLEKHSESKLLPSALAGAANAAFDAGDYQRALAHFQRFAREFPEDRRAAECLFYAGESLYRLNRFDEAKVVFGDMLTKHSDSPLAPEARAGLAWADYSLRRIREAAAGFEEAAKLAGEDSEAGLSFLYDAGCAWREAGEIQKAAEPLRKVAMSSEHELNSLAWFRLGTLWQEQAKTARERAENAINASEREQLSKRQKEIGEESIRYFRNALSGKKLGDEEVEARAFLGEALLDAGKYDEAVKEFAEIAGRWPDSERAPWALYHQALAEREQARAKGDPEADREGLRKAAAALEKSLGYPNARTRLQATWALADYLSALDETAAARERYRWLAAEGMQWAANWRDSAGRQDPSLDTRAREYAADSLFRLGESYFFASDHPRAAGFYEEITGKFPESPQAAMALLRLGEIADAGKDYSAALTRYQEALSLGMRVGKNRVGSTIGYAQLRLGTLLLREGQKEKDQEKRRRQLQEALRNLAAVVADPPGDLGLDRPYYYLAEAKYSLGLKSESVADYENSLKHAAKGDLSDAAWFGLAWAKRDLSDSAGAIEAAGKVVDEFPDSRLRPDAFSLAASIRRADGDPEGALVVLERFLKEYPGHALSAKAELERASALDETGRHAEAAEAFQRFLTLHPEHPDVPQALYQRSWALWNLLRPKAAEAKEVETRLKDVTGGRALSDLPETDRADAERITRELKALTDEVTRAENEILSALQDLTQRYPNYAVVDAAWLRMGEIYYDRGDFQQALAAYQKALSLASAKNSDLADKAQYRLAWSVQRLAEAAEKTSLTNPNPTRRESARKEMWDRRVAAIDAFESIIGRHPKSDLLGDACFRAAELRRRSGQDNSDPAKRSAWFQSATQRYRQAIEKGGADAPYRRAAEYGEGLCLLLDGKSGEAREVFRRLLLNPDGPYVQDAYWGLGQANLNLGAYADAASAFEQALAVDKTTETAAKSRYGLGMTAAMSGDLDKARLEFIAVDVLYPNYPEWAAAALVRAAKTAIDIGQKNKAIEDLEKVLASYSDTPAAEEAKELQAKLATE